MSVRLALVLALVLAVGMTRGTATSATATPPPAGSISGLAIDDENGNGVIDPGEPGLAGWEVFVTTGEKAQVAADGTYRLVGVPPGTYTVNLVAVVGGAGPPPPWLPTLPGPNLSYDVTVAPGQNLENVDFAIQLLDEAAVFSAEVMIDAAPAPQGTVVQALIGDAVCDEYTVGVGHSFDIRGPLVPPGRAPNTITIVVPSANEKAGCGSEGATITFLIDGRPTNESEPWYSGSHSVSMLTTGPPFARYLGTVSLDDAEVHGSEVTAYIGDAPCGSSGGLVGTYVVDVLPAELKPGCGEEGTTVRFTIGEAQAEETALWAPGQHELNLTAGTASISGRAIDDNNGNGVIEPGEPGLSSGWSWEVAIDGDGMEARAKVAGDGTYKFDGLAPGDYTVRLVAVLGGNLPPWIPTLPGPDLSYDAVVASGQSVVGIDFALQVMDEAAVFTNMGIVVDAAPAPEGTVVQALIGDTVCDEYIVGVGPSSGRQGPIDPPPREPNDITVAVPSANEKAGCGAEGAAITFLVNGQPANESEPWYSGWHAIPMLTAGPPSAWFWGNTSGGEERCSTVAAYVGDTPCGNQFPSMCGSYQVAVLSAELKPGCGTPGATVRFMIGETQAEQTAQWSAGHHELNLTAAAPTETPIPTPTASASPTPSRSTSHPTSSPTRTTAPTASVTPSFVGPGLGGRSSSDGGIDWWPFALTAGLVAAASGGALLVWARRRPRQAR